jgi:peroxiredoxin Q/BCP
MVLSAQGAAMLQAGDPIPEFNLMSTDGAQVSSAGLAGRRYVLYLYPKDDTPGCTTEACSFRDNLPKFADLGVPVYGVSPDGAASHGKFAAKHGLNFPLLADPQRVLIAALGAWVEKRMYGRTYMGVQRSTFVAGPNGRIEKVWEKVTPASHAAEVLAYLAAGS